MGLQETEGKMEGWLYLMRLNRFGLQYSRKRYFILEDNCLKSFKSIPTSPKEEPIRSAIIDSCIRVTDNGRESFHRKVFFIFTLYNTSDHNDQLKLGASSPEEAARWIHCLKDAALNPERSLHAPSRRKWQPFRLSVSKRMAHKSSMDSTAASSMHVDAMTSDVLAPSPWKIFGCQNGLRLFKEAKDKGPNGKHRDGSPAVMAVGVIEGTSEAIFRTLMCLGPSRSEWDFSFYRGCVVEHLDGHTDIVHIQLYNHWLPWGSKRRDLLLRRYWRREDDGTYVILYHSVIHSKCPPQNGYVRACIKSGGHVITPTKHGKPSIVKHMLAIDWKFWKPYLKKGASVSITIRVLERIAALREMFRAKGGNYFSELSPAALTRDIELPVSEKEEIKTEVDYKMIKDDKVTNDGKNPASSNLMGLDDAADEFYDVPEPSDDEHSDHAWTSNASPEVGCMDSYHTKLTTANIVKKLHDLAVQKKGYVDLQEMAREESVSLCYGATLPKDQNFNMPCSWAAADPSSFLIRAESYLADQEKVKAKSTLMQMVAADWLRSDRREDDLAGRPGGIVQRYAAQGRPEFFFIINIQVPGATTYNLALYYMLRSPLEETPLLERFVNGDDSFRNSRFKLIPYISKGSWIVKQSVGKKACLVGQALEVHYFRGKNYLELGIDVGSSTVARGVVSLVLGYLNNLVIEMAFLIQGNTPEELPEFLLGTCRLNHLDVSKSIPTDSVSIS
ncbi:protein ENHANCED DISEASE RESISTANCE 2-like isoform X1 [Nicotiana tomentosiformis]|uniref:protein ENHANCED DISEASE RESISTANCE 2-like isoform X1 n=1 Tax=Nicotiana tomentosiformis TaxID=4098 RepID=UPI00051BEF72|nr:protein ENHANCED DISEASE RESISTANCE 2-like [Nicotiana tomentosiformis]